MAKAFMVKRDGVLIGEFNGAQVKSLALSGKILPTDLIRESGSERWVVASDAANLEFAGQRGEGSIESDGMDESLIGNRHSPGSDPASAPAEVLRDSPVGDSGSKMGAWLGRMMARLAAVVALVAIGVGFGALVGSSSRGWYDYGNGMVNLDRVQGISGTCFISWKITKFDRIAQKETVTDEGMEFFTLNFNTRIRVQAFIANLPVGAKLTAQAYVMFDDFKLTLQPLPENADSALILARVEEWQADYAEIQARASGQSGILSLFIP